MKIVRVRRVSVAAFAFGFACVRSPVPAGGPYGARSTRGATDASETRDGGTSRDLADVIVERDGEFARQFADAAAAQGRRTPSFEVPSRGDVQQAMFWANHRSEGCLRAREPPECIWLRVVFDHTGRVSSSEVTDDPESAESDDMSFLHIGRPCGARSPSPAEVQCLRANLARVSVPPFRRSEFVVRYPFLLPRPP